MAETKNTGNTAENQAANANTETGAGAGTENNTGAATKTEEQIREELRQEYERAADKRVTDAIKKKEKEWAEKAAKERMSAEERAQAEEKERLAAQAKKDLDLTIKGLRLDVVDAISELGMDSGFRNLIAVDDLAQIADEDERKKALTTRIKGMKALFDAEVKKAVEKAKVEFLKGSTPATGESKTDENAAYADAKKTGNVKGMISAKMEAYHSRGEE